MILTSNLKQPYTKRILAAEKNTVSISKIRKKKRDKALREFLANRVYDYLREVDEQQNGQQTLEKMPRKALMKILSRLSWKSSDSAC